MVAGYTSLPIIRSSEWVRSGSQYLQATILLTVSPLCSCRPRSDPINMIHHSSTRPRAGQWLEDPAGEKDQTPLFVGRVNVAPGANLARNVV